MIRSDSTIPSVLPQIAVSVGDVAGVGPELALKCASLEEVTKICRPVLYGPRPVIERISDVVGHPLSATIVDVGQLDAQTLRPGNFSAQTGRASLDAFDRAIADTVAGETAAVVTGPIQKEAWFLAGSTFPGHTEMIAERLGVDDVCMMLTSQEISCVLATIHLPLADVPKSLTAPAVLKAIELGADAMRRRHQRPARVSVCGLNPHAGENGLMGHGEETSLIRPAILAARDKGIDVRGPLPPDTAFTPAIREQTDVYVCMYHDQGLIPLKALSFDDAVNVTLGLPIVRTSVDHGTAMDLAWQGMANHHSMLAAIQLAVELSRD